MEYAIARIVLINQRGEGGGKGRVSHNAFDSKSISKKIVYS